jgi:hypothetical protein
VTLTGMAPPPDSWRAADPVVSFEPAAG